MYYLIATTIYGVGYLLAFVMQRMKLASEREPYTIGSRLLIMATSLLSWAMVVIILVIAWVKSLGTYLDDTIDATPATKLPDGAATKPTDQAIAPRRHTNAAHN